MKQKILAFIYNKKNKKFLLLDMTKHPDHAPNGGRFTVTGGIEEKESPEKAVEREVREETGLDAEEIFPLNWGAVYNWAGEEFKEMNFIVFVKSKKVILNEENSKYEWLGLERFIKNIDWNDNKELLKKVLDKAIKKEVYFDKKEREQKN